MIKIHIDHIDNEDGRIWAVQDGKHYYTVHKVMVLGVTLQSKTAKKQPRAFLYGKGNVRLTITPEGRTTALVTRK